MRERRDARCIHRLHLFDKAEEVVELGQRVLGVGIGQFEPREVGDAFHIGQSQGHAVTGKVAVCRNDEKTMLRQRVRSLEQALEIGAGDGKKCHSFPLNQAKL
ncbi:hypothetical protein PCAR4_150034 [Paraburkholderia caribensis]|nr:hypothetical protein PCAR4_150034 [Paraburkholderia caribensis]